MKFKNIKIAMSCILLLSLVNSQEPVVNSQFPLQQSNPQSTQYVVIVKEPYNVQMVNEVVQLLVDNVNIDVVEVDDWGITVRFLEDNCFSDVAAENFLQQYISRDIIDVRRKWLPQTINAEAAEYHGLNQLKELATLRFNINQLDGAPLTFSVFDEDQPFPHTDFMNRLDATSAAAYPYSAHSTHVIGTIASAGTMTPRGKGLAPLAQIKAFCIVGECTSTHTDLVNFGIRSLIQDIQQGISIGSNHSWGYVPINQETRRFTTATQAWREYIQDVDNALLQNPNYLVISAAGNHRLTAPIPYTSSGQMNALNLLKNGLSVASIPRDNDADDSLNSSSFSSIGLTSDGRIKPDIAAIGSPTYSTSLNNSYCEMYGTSMAAPVASGTYIALQHLALQSFHKRLLRSDEMKAVLINSAKNPYGGRPSVDKGWGILDAYEAGLTILGNGHKGVQSFVFPENNTVIRIPFTIKTSYLEDVKLTLSWLDQGGSTLLTDVDATVFLNDDVNVRYEPWTLRQEDLSSYLQPELTYTYARRSNDAVNNVVKITLADIAQEDIRLGTQGYIEVRLVRNGYSHNPQFALAYSGVNL